MIQPDVIGWVACSISFLGASFATSHSRRLVFWGWLLFFLGNICWILYGISMAALPLIGYNCLRALLSLRGARNNSVRRKQQIKKRREICQ